MMQWKLVQINTHMYISISARGSHYGQVSAQKFYCLEVLTFVKEVLDYQESKFFTHNSTFSVRLNLFWGWIEHFLLKVEQKQE